MDTSQSPIPIGSVNNNLNIGLGADSYGQYGFEGDLEEVRIWNKELSVFEIRENMHRIITICTDNLISNYQFNENSGIVLDPVSFYDGTVNGATQAQSTAPIGEGISNSQTEADGTVDFGGSDYSVEYIQHDNANVVSTKINNNPSGTEGIPSDEIIFNDQYWIVNRYTQNGELEANMQFKTIEDISPIEEAMPDLLNLYHRAFNADDNWIALSSGSSASASDNTVTFSNIPQYGQFIIAKQSESSLPLTLVSFDVESNTDIITCVWSTEQEVGVRGFEIQRTENIDTGWETIGWIDANNKMAKNRYSWEDRKVEAFIEYFYRLRIIDLNGSYKFSPLRKGKIVGKELVSIYPNPVIDVLTIQSNINAGKSMSIKIYNVNGALQISDFWKIKKGKSSTELNVESLPPSIYFAEIKLDQNVYIKKFVVQK